MRRKARRVTRADYLAAGRGLARDIAADVRNTYCPKIGRLQWTCTQAECTCHLKGRIWVEPKWPGDAVRSQLLSLGDPITELGDVRIMDYGADSKTRYRVAVFCPGRDVCCEGDTPKMESDYEQGCNGKDEANELFEVFLRRQHAAGWKDYRP